MMNYTINQKELENDIDQNCGRVLVYQNAVQKLEE